MSDGCIQTGTRGTACILDRFDSVTSVLACCAIIFSISLSSPVAGQSSITTILPLKNISTCSSSLKTTAV